MKLLDMALEIHHQYLVEVLYNVDFGQPVN